MNDYEHMIVSAVRYALGRMTYIVEMTVNYILKEMEANKLSKECLKQIKKDIEEEIRLGQMSSIDRYQWTRLKVKIEEVI